MNVSSALRRYPYVSEVVGNSATLNWATDRSQTTGTAKWGAVVNGQCSGTSNSVTATKVSITVGSTPEYQWPAVLNFPSTGTYCYRVQLGSVDLLGSDASPRVPTAATPGSSFSFAVFGDFGAGTSDQANVMSGIGASPASFVATVGDNVYNSGNETEYGDLTQGNLFPPQYLPALHGKPFFATEGNHGFSTRPPVPAEPPAKTAAATIEGRFKQEALLHLDGVGVHNYPSVVRSTGARPATCSGGVGRHPRRLPGRLPRALERLGLGLRSVQRTGVAQSDLAAHRGTLKLRSCTTRSTPTAAASPSDTYLSGPNKLEGAPAEQRVGMRSRARAPLPAQLPADRREAARHLHHRRGGGAVGHVSTMQRSLRRMRDRRRRIVVPGAETGVQHERLPLPARHGEREPGHRRPRPIRPGGPSTIQTYVLRWWWRWWGDTTPPSVPKNLTRHRSSGAQVDLNWQASTDNVRVTGYAITRNGSRSRRWVAG